MGWASLYTILIESIRVDNTILTVGDCTLISL